MSNYIKHNITDHIRVEFILSSVHQEWNVVKVFENDSNDDSTKLVKLPFTDFYLDWYYLIVGSIIILIILSFIIVISYLVCCQNKRKYKDDIQPVCVASNSSLHNVDKRIKGSKHSRVPTHDIDDIELGIQRHNNNISLNNSPIYDNINSPLHMYAHSYNLNQDRILNGFSKPGNAISLHNIKGYSTHNINRTYTVPIKHKIQKQKLKVIYDANEDESTKDYHNNIYPKGTLKNIDRNRSHSTKI